MTLPDHPFLQHRNPSTHKGRLGIARAERLQALQFPNQGKLHVDEPHLRVHVHGGNLLRALQQSLDGSPKPVPETGKRFLPDRETRGHGMPAEGHQVRFTVLQGPAHVEAGHAPDRPLADPLRVERHHDRGPVIAFHQPRRDDADHANMPPFRADHNRGLRVPGVRLRNRLTRHLFFNLSPVAVQVLQFLGKLKRRGFGFRGEQPDTQLGMSQSSGRIQARGHAKPDRTSRTRPVQTQIPGQRPDPAARALSHLGQPVTDQGPVLIRKRNQIGDGRQRHQVAVRLHRHARGPVFPHVRVGHLVGQAAGT